MDSATWTSVLQHVNSPIALAGLALLVLAGVFQKLGGKADRKNRHFLVRGLVALGAVALVGSLVLAYSQGRPAETSAAPETSVSDRAKTKQEAKADNGGTAINVGRDYEVNGTSQTAEPREAPSPVEQKASAQGGTAINVGGDYRAKGQE